MTTAGAVRPGIRSSGARFGRAALTAATAAGLLVAAALAAFVLPGELLALILPGAVGLAVIAAAVYHPATAVLVLIVAMFFRLPTPEIPMLPVDLFVFLFAVALGSFGLWITVRPDRIRQLGMLEIFMGLFVLWNFWSMFASHRFPAVVPLTSQPTSVSRFIIIGTVIPFAVFVMGRLSFDRERAVRGMLWTVTAIAAFSAMMSIFQLKGPTALVWPHYMLENEHWPGRAVGVTNQPVGNGTILIFGFIVTVVLASQRSEPVRLRRLAAVISVACAYGVFLTYTRAVWLAFGIVVLVGLLCARGFRRAFALTATAMVVAVAMNWSTFTSADRKAGGVGSTSEIHDRLNAMATAFWAIREEPLTGWGVARFVSVNTYFHRAWGPSIPWEGGFGIDAHFTELGIFAELGIVGGLLWITVLVLLVVQLVRAYRRLPPGRLTGQPLAIAAVLAVLCLLVTGFTAELRNFDVTNAMALLIAGVAIGWSDRFVPRKQDLERSPEEVSS
ncbi:O-antigen ligase family protein [Rhodococcus rhodochrous]|uniref:O-antigen ligase family protein n=1 Tax=Rhodococcus rhodochrous TaxID=1829 RepID=UPI0023F75AE6